MLLLVLALLWFVPELQGKYFSQGVPAEDLPPLVNEYRKTWAQIIAGFFVLLGLYFTWRRVEISQEQQITERFTRPIDQLGAVDEKGNKKLEIRLGGIYALERIAKDSAIDHWPIMETLTTYVREHAFCPPRKRLQAGADAQTMQRQQEPPYRPDDRPQPDIFGSRSGYPSDPYCAQTTQPALLAKASYGSEPYRSPCFSSFQRGHY